LGAIADPSSGIASIGPNPPEQDLRTHLAAALTAAGFGEICLDDDRPPTAPVGPRWSGGLISLTLSASTALALQVELGCTDGLTAAIAVVLWVGILKSGRKAVSLLLLYGLWLVLAGVLWATHGFWNVAESYGVPLVAAACIYGLLKARNSRLGIDLKALFRSMPLLFPLVLLLLLVPLVTQDLWRIAVTVGAVKLALLALLTVVPLTLVFGSKLIASLQGVISETTALIATRPESVPEIQSLIEQLVGAYAGSWVLNNGRAMIQQGYDAKVASEYVPFMTATVKRPLARALALRTIVMLLGLGAAVFAYLYSLAVILVDSEVAQEWSKDLVSRVHMQILGLDVTLLGGPYLATAGLLSIIALGAFLALLTVEESYSRAMAGALVNEPVKDYLLLGLPYMRLRERKILGEAPTDQSGPLAPAPESLPG
jgi:hypothetical protein